jgi:hypothetical protein
VFDTGGVSPPLVIVAGLPLADLLAWGVEPAGSWWALITWSSDYQRPDQPARFSAWVPARELTPSLYPAQQRAYRDVLRVQLTADQASWPWPWTRGGVWWRHFGATADPGQLAHSWRYANAPETER